MPNSCWAWLVDPLHCYWQGMRTCSGVAPCVERNGTVQLARDSDPPWTHLAVADLLSRATLSQWVQLARKALQDLLRKLQDTV